MRWASYATIVALCGSLLGVAPGHADHQPLFVVPGRADVPVIIDGYDASWAVLEGEWGLFRPGHAAPTVIYPFLPAGGWRTRSYYPFTGIRPRYGRHEIIPPANRRLPPPAESFHRYWSSPPIAPPASITEYPAFEPPPIVLAPRLKSLN